MDTSFAVMSVRLQQFSPVKAITRPGNTSLASTKNVAKQRRGALPFLLRRFSKGHSLPNQRPSHYSTSFSIGSKIKSSLQRGGGVFVTRYPNAPSSNRGG